MAELASFLIPAPPALRRGPKASRSSWVRGGVTAPASVLWTGFGGGPCRGSAQRLAHGQHQRMLAVNIPVVIVAVTRGEPGK